jgi:LmbE family N-acetylglucosaminyl deacetylase
MNPKKITLILWATIICSPTWAQSPKKPNAAEIRESIRKLNFLGSVLYVAAHPDDENTRLISYLANHDLARTTYLSLTRGDGGQNLIGTELREYLGVLRTQELLAARRMDGGLQLFSRANDFGFSKTPEETMRIWNKDEVLSDVVWAIRQTQPDIIINRFSTDTKIETHGHHTSSAILSAEAFDLAGKPDAFPQHLKQNVSVWQPKRLFCNQSWFFYGREKFDAMDKSKFIQLDVGVFYPSKGKSNNEIAAESRSMHRCQGMGALTSRGSDLEYLDFLKGDKRTTNLWEGINTTWTRVQGDGATIAKNLEKVYKKFDYEKPAMSVPELIYIYGLIQKLPNQYWKTVKLKEIESVIGWCLGFYLEATTNTASVVAGQSLEVNVEVVNRSYITFELKNISIAVAQGQNRVDTVVFDTIYRKGMVNNEKKTFKFKTKIVDNASITAPYWLTEVPSLGMYRVDELALRGMPNTPRNVSVTANIVINNCNIPFTVEAVHLRADPAKGEIYRPLEVTPAGFVNLTEKAYVFANDSSKIVQVRVKAQRDGLKGTVRLQMPTSWRAEPAEIVTELAQKDAEKTVTFQVFPPKQRDEASLIATIQMGEMIVNQSVQYIDYDHIPTQTVVQTASAHLVRLEVAKKGTLIGYFVGAGDDIPACLEQIGYKVQLLEDKDFKDDASLKQFDAIVMGIRAYNTKEKLKFYQTKLLKYVENGGNLIVQYNTNGRDLLMKNLGPYPFELSRERVTVEEATIRVLKPEHPVLNTPNKISDKDFEGWVQERGLYFPTSWDKNYDAPLSCNDPNEPARDGGLLVTKYGKGYYVYTGYAWFRQLPAGVSGAYRIFANMLSLGK